MLFEVYRMAPNFRGRRNIFVIFVNFDHENFCYEIFLTAASSTALDTSKS